MVELVQDYWILFVIALIVGLLVAWWIFAASRRTKVQVEQRDEEAPTAPRRNQALIDAAPAASVAAAEGAVPPAGFGIAGTGAALAAATTTVKRTSASNAASTEAPAPAPKPAPARAPATSEPAPAREPEAEVASPPAPATEPEPAPPPAPAPAPTASASAEADQLLRIKGLGPKLAQQLHAMGVTSLAQVAAWDEDEIDRIDAQLGRFQGRIRRDDWPLQARLLTAGDTAAYEERFGRL